MPFIICVRLTDKAGILAAMEARAANDTETEIATALAEIGKITAASGGSGMTLAAPTLSAPTLSTHVLDTMHGTPAMGMAITLAGPHGLGARVHQSGWRAPDLVSGLTEGRLPAGHFRLTFGVAAYFRARGVLLPDPPFLDEVTIDFNMAPDGGHYHVPLLVTPYGYSTYRGS
jgi:hydroxyisourate hydrolase